MVLVLEAHAKINLTLEVLGKRGDGYHEIRSVMRSLALHDTLTVEQAPDLEIRCDVDGLDGENNLVYAAAVLLREASGCDLGARITIAKAVPVAAGLGGGSSDAAAALTGLNELWHMNLGQDALHQLAARLGSDVPFFLLGGTVLASGRGEVLGPLPDQPDCAVVLVNPGFGVSTAGVYGRVDPSMYVPGAVSRGFAQLDPSTPPSCWPLANTLQQVTTALHPEVAEVPARLREWGAVQAQMCGSGPTCFGLFTEQTASASAVRAAEQQGWSAWETHFASGAEAQASRPSSAG